MPKRKSVRKKVKVKTRSRQPPSGDKRLTINIRADIHKKLKVAAAKRETTVGELIEELAGKHLR